MNNFRTLKEMDGRLAPFYEVGVGVGANFLDTFTRLAGKDSKK